MFYSNANINIRHCIWVSCQRKWLCSHRALPQSEPTNWLLASLLQLVSVV